MWFNNSPKKIASVAAATALAAAATRTGVAVSVNDLVPTNLFMVLKVTNGATAVTTPCVGRVEVTMNGVDWFEVERVPVGQISMAANGLTTRQYLLPPCKLARAVFSGNDQAVTVEAFVLGRKR